MIGASLSNSDYRNSVRMQYVENLIIDLDRDRR